MPNTGAHPSSPSPLSGPGAWSLPLSLVSPILQKGPGGDGLGWARTRFPPQEASGHGSAKVPSIRLSVSPSLRVTLAWGLSGLACVQRHGEVCVWKTRCHLAHMAGGGGWGLEVMATGSSPIGDHFRGCWYPQAWILACSAAFLQALASSDLQGSLDRVNYSRGPGPRYKVFSFPHLQKLLLWMGLQGGEGNCFILIIKTFSGIYVLVENN